MSRVLTTITILAGLTALLGAGVRNQTPSVLTVIMDFKGPHASTSVDEMKRESGLILKTTGVSLDWKVLGKDSLGTYSDLVVMTFKGTCEYEPAAPRYDELGPLAVTRTTNGEVQPFGEVDCDRVVNSARSAMQGPDFARADMLIGRAMGRVVAHELVHMLTKSQEHATEGVYKPALSGKALISASLPLSALDVDHLQQRFTSKLR